MLTPQEMATSDPLKPALERVAAGDLDGARKRLDDWRRESSADPALWWSSGRLRLICGDPVGARADLARAAELGAEGAEFGLDLGLAAFRCGRWREAIASLAPLRDGTGLLAVAIEARARVALGDRQTARRLLRHLEPTLATPVEQMNECALAWMALEDYARADEVLRLALLKAPEDPYLIANLAQIAERANRLDEAEQWLCRLPGLDLPSRLLESRLRGRRGDPELALRLLGDIEREPGPGPLDSELQAQIAFERANWLDRTGAFQAAWAAAREGNRLDQQAHERATAGLGSGTPESSWWLDDPGLDPPPLDAEEPSDLPTDPVLVVGYPRSGTTLLDRMLATRDDLTVMEEEPVLQPVIERLAAHPQGVHGALRSLTAADVAILRAQYWQEVESRRIRPGGRRLVDKNPLYLLHAQLLARLFPRASWIFVIRDPRDVVLSCFMRRFRFTEATRGFWVLEDIVALYAKTLALWLTQRRRLGLDCLDLRYEELVEDPGAGAARLCAHLGLAVDARMERPERAAAGRWINTPSYAQVSEPIHRQAVGRWRAYRAFLEPAIVELASVADGLGYTWEQPGVPR